MRVSLLLCGVFVSAAVLLIHNPVYAADDPAGKAVQKEQPKENTPLDKLNAATDEMMKGLDENQLRQFASIKNAHGIIRAVEDVQQSVLRGVESCTKANPDIADPLNKRFEDWKEVIRPVMKQARARLDKMILLQGFAQPSQVRGYLKKFDAAVVYRNQGVKAVPVTDKSDCQKLQASMDKTQDNLSTLLTDALNLNADLKVKE